MTLDDPARPLIGPSPAWADAPNLAIPQLRLTPQGEASYAVAFMFPSKYGPYAFSWVERVMEVGQELNTFLLDWWQSPEESVRKYFALEPPKGRAFTIREGFEPEIEADASLVDLGL